MARVGCKFSSIKFHHFMHGSSIFEMLFSSPLYATASLSSPKSRGIFQPALNGFPRHFQKPNILSRQCLSLDIRFTCSLFLRRYSLCVTLNTRTLVSSLLFTRKTVVFILFSSLASIEYVICWRKGEINNSSGPPPALLFLILLEFGLLKDG